MTNPTSAFGWQMPQNTDLVTDLPADFEVFGQAVDTSMADLLGGTTGQILAKNSATNMDFVWITNDQGDITGVTAGTGITVTSPTGPVPTVSIDTATTVDKTTAQTLTNKTLTSPVLTTPSISNINAKGDILVGTADNTLGIITAGSNGETLVADSSATTGLRYQGSQVAGRNCIINGGMDIWQRGTTFTGAQYGADRWNSSSGSNTYTITRETGISSFQYALKIALTGSNSFSQIGTQIEFANCYLLQNQPVTISFYAQANNANAGSTTLTVRNRTIAGVDGACLFAGTGVSSNVTLTTSPVRYSVTRTLPATFGSLSLEFSTPAGVTGDGFTITGIQMELGSVASAFSRTGGTIQGELAACQRYYLRITPSAALGRLGVGDCYTTTTAQIGFNFPVTMRIAPTALEQSGTATDYSVRSGAGPTVCSAVPTFLTGDPYQSFVTLTVAAGLVVGNAAIMRPVLTSAYLGWSAEL